MSYIPTIPLTVDSGYTGNAGAGTKATVVPNYAGGLITGTMQTAANVVSANLGTWPRWTLSLSP